MGVEGLRFLAGIWRGAGTVRGDAVTSRVEGSLRDDGAIVLDHVTMREGAADHRERIVVLEERGRLRAYIRAASGPEQRFQGGSVDFGWRFTRADPKLGHLAWEVAPDGDDRFEERFVMGEGAAAETVVRLRHERA